MASYQVDDFGNPIGRPDLSAPAGLPELQGLLSRLFQSRDAGPSGNVGLLGSLMPQPQMQQQPLAPPMPSNNPPLIPAQPPSQMAPALPAVATPTPQAVPQQVNPLDRLSIALHNFGASPGLATGVVDAIRGGQGGPSMSGQLIDLGTDLLGNVQKGVYDPITQSIKAINVGAGSPSESSSGTSNVPAIREAMNMPAVYNAEGRDEQFLSALDPVSRKYVEGILNGDTAPAIGRNLQRFLPIAARAENGFTQQTYQARVNALKDETSGKTSELKRAVRQSALHFGELVDSMKDLPGHQMPIMNWAANFANTNILGKGKQGAFEINAHALADELSKMFKSGGAGATDTEIRAWESRLSPDMSQEQQRDMTRKLLQLYEAGMEELDRKRQEGLGPTLYNKAPHLITPEVNQSLSNVRKFAQGQPEQSATGLPAGWTVKVH